MRNEFLTPLGALAKPSGLARLQEHLVQTDNPLTPLEAAQLYTLLQSELSDDPTLEDVKVRVGPTGHGGGVYFPKADLVSVGKATPAAMAHELGHAKSVGRSGEFYRTVQDTAREVSNVTNRMAVAVPLAAVIPLLVRAAKAGRGRSFGAAALNALTGVTVAANVPTLIEETAASLDAVKHMPDKLEATKEMAKTLGAYSAAAAAPVVAFQVAKRFL